MQTPVPRHVVRTSIGSSLGSGPARPFLAVCFVLSCVSCRSRVHVSETEPTEANTVAAALTSEGVDQQRHVVAAAIEFSRISMGMNRKAAEAIVRENPNTVVRWEIQTERGPRSYLSCEYGGGIKTRGLSHMTPPDLVLWFDEDSKVAAKYVWQRDSTGKWTVRRETSLPPDFEQRARAVSSVHTNRFGAVLAPPGSSPP